MIINGKDIGKGSTYIIAEAGVNHNGKIELAEQLIDKASESGADAVKFQSFKAEEMCVRDLTEKKKIAALTGGSQSAFDMYKALELSEQDHKHLFTYAEKRGITIFSSVFDLVGLKFLQDLHTPALKISSGDLTFLPLIKDASQTGIPILLSTGMGTVSEIARAHEVLKKGHSEFALLHCVALYPPKYSEINLNFISTLKHTFNVITGFSDHTEGITASVAAVAMGADIIEKHFTLDNDMEGPDQKLSLNPCDFKEMVKSIRAVEKMKGSYQREISLRETEGIIPGRRGIKARRSVKAGEILQKDDLIVIKPEKGIKPEFTDDLAGHRLLNDIKAGEPISWFDIAD